MVGGNAWGQTVEFTTSPSLLLPNQPVTFINQSTGLASGTIFVWKFGDLCGILNQYGTNFDSIICRDTTYSLSQTTTHTYAKGKPYSVSLIALQPGMQAIEFSKIVIINGACNCNSTTCEMICNGSFQLWGFCPESEHYLGSLYSFPPTQDATTCWYHFLPQPTAYYLTSSCISSNGNSYNNRVPNNAYGCENDHNSPVPAEPSYTGVYTWSAGNPYPIREYLQQNLGAPLQNGVNYFVSFWVSLADNADYASNIGAYISDVPPPVFAGTYLANATPQVSAVLSYGSFLTNYSGWVQIQGTIMGTGVEQYITIGNFEDDNANNSLYLGGGGTCNTWHSPTAFYYVDDVSISKLIPSASITNATCSNSIDGAIHLTVAGGSGIYTYQWSNGATTQNITGVGTGTYVVTVTDLSGGCSVMASFTVNSNSSQPCCSWVPGTDFVWNGDITITDLITFYLPSTFIAPNSYDCATGAFYTTITSPAGANLVINGNLTINASVIFRDLHLVMGGGKEIKVLNTSNFINLIVQSSTSSGTVLRTCVISQWKGINLQGVNSRLLMLNGNSFYPYSIKFLDAINGVNANANALYLIDNVEFRRCYRGVYVDNSANTLPGIKCLITNSLFTCVDDVLGLPTTMLGFTTRGNAGVEIKQGRYYTVGYDWSQTYLCSPQPNPNIFQYLENGVTVTNSFFTTIVNNEFKDLTSYTGNPGGGVGNGVIITGTSAFPSTVYVGNVAPGAIAQGNIFRNCRFGIRAKTYTELHATQNNFYNQAVPYQNFTGIDFLLPNGIFNSHIYTNYFWDECDGITVNQVQSPNYSIEINNNYIYGHLDAATGIPASASGIGVFSTITSFNLNIHDNLAIDNFRSGIRINKNVNSTVTGNRIHYTCPSWIAPNSNTQFSRGIFLSLSGGSTVKENVVEWLNHPTPQTLALTNGMQGIRIENSTGGAALGVIECNRTTGMTSGIYLQGQVDANDFKTNTIQEAYYGFNLLTAQLPNPFGTAAASYYNTFSSFTGALPLHVAGSNNGTAANWYYSANGALDDPHPFAAGVILTPAPIGATIMPCSPFTGGGGEGGQMMVQNLEDIAQDAIPYSYFPDESKYMADKFAFETLKQDTALIDSSAILEQFFIDKSQENIGKYKEVESDIENNLISNAVQKLLAITDVNQIEINKKLVLQIYINKIVAGIDLDAADTATLETIAYTPAIVGGEAVHWARGILHIEVDDKLLLMQQYRMSFDEEKAAENKNETIKPLIFPNPASYGITFFCNEKLSYTITDLFGRELLSGNIHCNESEYETIDILSLRQGVYNLQVITAGLQQKVKLVVVK